jgi:hypothetical protein
VVDRDGNVCVVEATSLGTAMMIAEERLGIQQALLQVTPISGGPEIL